MRYHRPILTALIFLSLNLSWAHAETAQDDVHLGNVSGREDKNPEAIKYYTKAIKLDPNLANAYYNRGYVYLKTRKYKQAITDLNMAVNINPSYAAAYHLRGIAYFYKKRYPEAVTNYNEAIKIDPDNIKYLISRMSANFKLGYGDKVWKDVIRIQKLGGTVDPAIINILKNKNYREKTEQ